MDFFQLCFIFFKTNKFHLHLVHKTKSFLLCLMFLEFPIVVNIHRKINHTHFDVISQRINNLKLDKHKDNVYMYCASI